MSDQKHIPGQPSTPQQEDILNYLNNNMGNAQQHDFERASSEDEFMNDAMEGLESLKAGKTDLSLIAHQLNADFKKQLDKKNKRKAKRKYVEQPWIYFAVVLIILLLVAAFIVVQKLT